MKTDKTLIIARNGFTLSENDAIALAGMLAKMGYSVRQRKIRPDDKPKAAMVRAVEFWIEEDGDST